MRMYRSIALGLVLTIVAMFSPSVDAQDFYKGKTVTLVVPYAPGGTYDLMGRLVSKHMRQFIPGNPEIIVENIPGGGGLIGLRNVYKAAPDGLRIVHAPSTVTLTETLGQVQDVQFKEFQWLGCAAGSTYVVLLRSEVAKPFEDLRKSKTLVKLGILGPGGLIHEAGKFVRALSGLNVQLVGGYQGYNNIALAIRQGEIDGVVVGTEVMFANALTKEMYQAGLVKPILVFGGSRPAEAWKQVLHGLPDFPSMVGDRTDRAALDALNKLIAVSRVFMTTPKTPPDRVAMLREALWKTFESEAFRTEAKQGGFDIDPVDGPGTEEALKVVFGLDPEARERLKQIIN
jgi:tripartite-type tricarboxylate transporter receptor subunit TctC